MTSLCLLEIRETQKGTLVRGSETLSKELIGLSGNKIEFINFVQTNRFKFTEHCDGAFNEPANRRLDRNGLLLSSYFPVRETDSEKTTV